MLLCLEKLLHRIAVSYLMTPEPTSLILQGVWVIVNQVNSTKHETFTNPPQIINTVRLGL